MNTEAAYHQLRQELQPYFKMLGDAAETILDNEVSKYPIFVVHKFDELELGIPLIQRTEYQRVWSLQASTLEELATKGLIEMEKVDQFRRVFKDPREYLCLFVLMDTGAHFVFLPRK